MTRRPATFLVLAAAVVTVLSGLAGQAAASDALTPTLVPIGRLHFPERGFLVGFPRHVALDASRIRVYENGKPVVDPSFVPAAASKQRLGIVLVIDDSDSMRGQPLADAFGSARSFAGRLRKQEDVGVLSFNNGTRVLVFPTRDHGTIDAALSTPPATAPGTHVYDAVARALELLRERRVSAGAVVLLSDGADTGSSSTAAAVERRARAEHVRIFTVGLRSSAFAPAVLKDLARRTSGAYSEAGSSAQLKPIYGAIGSQLASEYVLRYRSDANPGAQVSVLVKVVGGGSVDAAYHVPRATTLPPFHRSVGSRFVGSAASAAILAFFVAALVAGAVFLVARAPRSNLRDRLREFVSVGHEQLPEKKRTPSVSKAVFGGAERSLSRTGWWERFCEELEIAEIPLTPEQLVAAAVIGTILAAVVLALLGPVFVVFALFVPLAIRALCKRRLRKVRDQFAQQLPDNLQMFASALRAGHSFVGALAVVAADCAEPSKREFQRVIADEQLGVPVEESLRTVARRMDNSDLEQVALVAELQRQAGGNMAEVLDRVIETIRARFDLRRLIKTLTAQGRMARWIISGLPVGLAVIISLLNPGYMAPLFHSPGGQIAIVVAILMIITGSIVIQRIVDIKV